MNRLGERLKRLIEAGGPIGIDQYMALCLYDREDGYYTTREPFGADGDFTTAPEISQMFGELVAVWLASAWNALGRPTPITLAEIGPGRGTLMADMLRTLRQAAPDLIRSAKVVMIEVSPRLQAIQKSTLSKSGAAIDWIESVSDLPQGPLLLIGNEIFDAIPMRQFVKATGGWRERVVAVEDGRLAFAAGSAGVDPGDLPAGAATAPEGMIAELAPAREALMDEIAHRIARDAGAALFFDYGYRAPALGDTLQALRRHAYVSPLDAPGEADLTSHVDFGALAAVARNAGLAEAMLAQGEFLLGMGLLERAGRLGSSWDKAGREAIRDAAERLAGPDRMGILFKALAVTSFPSLPPFSQSH